MALNVEDFESLIVLRPLRPDDYDAPVELEKKCLPGIATWKRGQLESQIARFPKGQICIEVDGKVVASSSSLIVDVELLRRNRHPGTVRPWTDRRKGLCSLRYKSADGSERET